MMEVLFLSLMSLMGLQGLSGIGALVFLFMILLKLFKHEVDWFAIYGSMMMDKFSLVLVMLSVWITLLMLMTMVFSGGNKQLILSLVIILLMSFLVVVFCVTNYIMFYVMFEACLVPTLFLIIGWGYQPERVQAGSYMMLYTVVASLPLLLVILFLKSLGVTNMVVSCSLGSGSFLGSIFLLFLLLAFLVKLPVYTVHLWLPKAHVEAPVAGSMILAGLLLKLGGYGVLRMMSSVGSLSKGLLVLMVSWSMFGGLVVSVVCLRQVDIKSLIALSSVAHMAMVIGGLLTQSVWGLNGALFIMIGHGLCSSGLFCIANLAYLRVGSRSMSIMKGLQGLMPSMGLFWFMLASSNMAAPPSLSLFGEMSSIISVLSWSKVLMWVVGGLVFFSAVYSLFMYASTQHGKSSVSVTGYSLFSVLELKLVLLHWLPLNFLFLVWGGV